MLNSVKHMLLSLLNDWQLLKQKCDLLFFFLPFFDIFCRYGRFGRLIANENNLSCSLQQSMHTNLGELQPVTLQRGLLTSLSA